MHDGVVKVSQHHHAMVMTSESNSQSGGSDSPAVADPNNNDAEMGGDGAAGIELIVAIDGDLDGVHTPRVLTGGSGRHERPAGSRSGSVPDMMRLLPPITRDHDSESAVQQRPCAGGSGLSLRSTRSVSPLLALDRSGGPGPCFRAADSEKMLPVLLAVDDGLAPGARSRSPPGHVNSLSPSLSPRPPPSSLPHHHADKPSDVPHHLHRWLSEGKHRPPLAQEPLGMTRDGPLNHIPDTHSCLLRQRSCQSPNRLAFPIPERRRASEGVLNVTPSQLGLLPKPRAEPQPRLHPSKSGPSSPAQRSRREIGELMSTVPGRKSAGQKTAHGPGPNRLSRLNSASVESLNQHGAAGTCDDDQERQRILDWLVGVKKGRDGQTDELTAGQFDRLSRKNTETAIRIIHKDQT